MFNILTGTLYKNQYKNRGLKQNEGGKQDPQMTNLKAGSGPTSEPVQGPHSGLILGVARWSFNRLLGTPNRHSKGPLSAERSSFGCFVVLELAFWRGVKWPSSGCPL